MITALIVLACLYAIVSIALFFAVYLSEYNISFSNSLLLGTFWLPIIAYNYWYMYVSDKDDHKYVETLYDDEPEED